MNCLQQTIYSSVSLGSATSPNGCGVSPLTSLDPSPLLPALPQPSQPPPARPCLRPRPINAPSLPLDPSPGPAPSLNPSWLSPAAPLPPPLSLSLPLAAPVSPAPPFRACARRPRSARSSIHRRTRSHSASSGVLRVCGNGSEVCGLSRPSSSRSAPAPPRRQRAPTAARGGGAQRPTWRRHEAQAVFLPVEPRRTERRLRPRPTLPAPRAQLSPTARAARARARGGGALGRRGARAAGRTSRRTPSGPRGQANLAVNLPRRAAPRRARVSRLGARGAGGGAGAAWARLPERMS